MSPVCVAPVAPPISTIRDSPLAVPGQRGLERDLLAPDEPVAASYRGVSVAGEQVGAAHVGLAGDEQFLGGEAGEHCGGRSW